MSVSEPHRAATTLTGAPRRRDLKKAATRTALLEAALRVVAQHGVEKVTIDQIVAEADVAQRTFFNHFSTKEEALVATTVDSAGDVLVAFRTRPPGESVLHALRGAVHAVFDAVQANDPVRAEAQRAIRTARSLMPYHLALFESNEHDLAEAIRERVAGEGGETDPLYPQLCAATAYSTLRVILARWLTAKAGAEAPQPTLFLDEFERALTMFTNGIDRPSTMSVHSLAHASAPRIEDVDE